MSLLDGIKQIGSDAIGMATAPLRTAGKMVGTGLETSGNALTKLAEGDVGGAVGAVGEGAKKQVGNVTGHFGEQFDNAKGIAQGYGEVLTSGAAVIGEPIQGVARLAGNGLTTAGQTTTSLANGDIAGAVTNQVQGAGNAVGIVGDTASNQWNNIAG